MQNRHFVDLKKIPPLRCGAPFRLWMTATTTCRLHQLRSLPGLPFTTSTFSQHFYHVIVRSKTKNNSNDNSNDRRDGSCGTKPSIIRPHQFASCTFVTPSRTFCSTNSIGQSRIGGSTMEARKAGRIVDGGRNMVGSMFRWNVRFQVGLTTWMNCCS